MKSAYTPGTAPIETSVAAAHGERMRGRGERFDAVPLFWTEQYAQDCTITYRRAGKKLAVAVVHRDLDGVRAELEFEQAMAKLA